MCNLESYRSIRVFSTLSGIVVLLALPMAEVSFLHVPLSFPEIENCGLMFYKPSSWLCSFRSAEGNCGIYLFGEGRDGEMRSLRANIFN